MNAKAALLEPLSRDSLKALIKAMRVPNADLRSQRRMLEAMVHFEPATPEILLQLLPESEISQLCHLFGLSSGQGGLQDRERLRTALGTRDFPDTLSRHRGAVSDARRRGGKTAARASKLLSHPYCGSFVALDFETADYGQDSACALALVRVENDEVVERTSFLIRPPRRQFVFTYIHGITWPMVAKERTFAELWPEIDARLAGVEFLAAHNASFDRNVMGSCCTQAGVRPPDLEFHCTVQLARRTWNLRPTTLPHVCQYLGLALKHHDAASDAEACAQIVLAARRSAREEGEPLETRDRPTR